MLVDSSLYPCSRYALPPINSTVRPMFLEMLELGKSMPTKIILLLSMSLDMGKLQRICVGVGLHDPPDA